MKAVSEKVIQQTPDPIERPPGGGDPAQSGWGRYPPPGRRHRRHSVQNQICQASGPPSFPATFCRGAALRLILILTNSFKGPFSQKTTAWNLGKMRRRTAKPPVDKLCKIG